MTLLPASKPSSSVRYRPTWAEISASAFVSNLNSVRQFVGPKVKILAVLKADAYGHGALALAPLAVNHGVSFIGVSSLEEGISLREAGIAAPILLLGGVYPLDNFSVALEHDLTPTVASLEAAEHLASMARRKGHPAEFHLKVDTGMGRIGTSLARAKEVLSWVEKEPRLKLTGLYSHFSSADNDAAFSAEQLARFQELTGWMKSWNFPDIIFHMANSAALISNPSFHMNMVRPGISLYGINPLPGPSSLKLSPVLSWHSKGIFLKRVPAMTPISYGRTYITSRTTDVLTVPVGYADGVPRLFSNKGWVLVKGKRCPILGRVTMDHLMVDVTGLNAAVGEPVTLIGRQGGEEIRADEWALWAETISYEILCGISKRVPRVVTA